MCKCNGAMGCGLGSLRLIPHREPIKVPSKLEVVLLSRAEADYILADPAQRKGAYLVYEDVDSRKQYLAFRSATEVPKHYSVVKRNDLYYIGGFPFPYLEAIILYYQRHRFDGTLLTEPAFIFPYITATKRPARSPPPPRNRSLPRRNYSLRSGKYRSVKTL